MVLCYITVGTTNEGRDDVRAGGADGGQHVRSRLGLQTRAGMTYCLEVQREGDMSDRGWDYKRGQGWCTSWRWRGRATCKITVGTTNEGRDDVLHGGGEEGQRVGSRYGISTRA